MTEINLAQFCGDEDWRTHLHYPFSHGEFTYATNGHICVRVPRVEGTLEASGKQIEAHGKLVKYFQEAEQQSPEPINMNIPEEPRKEECKYCGGGRKADHDCPCCECACEECDGTGYVSAKQRVSFENFDIDAKYFRMIARLPNAKLSRAAVEELKPIFFTFDGGCGLIMAMTRANPYGEEIITAESLAERAA